MEQVLVNESSLQDIANAIREKTGGTEPILPSEMGDVIRAIETGESALKYATGSIASGTAKTVTVTGLTFTPAFVFFYSTSGPSLSAGTADVSYSTYYSNKFTNTLTITEGGFTFTASNNIKSGTATWHAYGF